MIPGILHLNSKIKYGITSRNSFMYLFKPLDSALQEYIVGCSSTKKTNVLALINPETKDKKLPRGNLVKIIGDCGNILAEQEALLYQYSQPGWKKFDKTKVVLPAENEHRFVAGYAFNVDPQGCRDIDDAILIGIDGFIYIAIADVACWLVKNPDIFEKASKIGQTLYSNGQVQAPLLPIQDECSLFPDKTRKAVALKFKWNGAISDISFEKIEFVNTESFTYENISQDNKKLLKEISSFLANKPLSCSHEWISELMIFYNSEAAKILIQKKEGLLRIQSSPEKSEYKDFVDISFLENKAAEYAYANIPQKHWALNKEYCHATSPIRRFADIVNQMVLRKDPELSYSIAELNKQSTNAKKFERESFFMCQILGSEKRETAGIVLNNHRIWIPEWKRMITCKNENKLGERGVVKYSLSMDRLTWKKRMVFRFECEDTGCPE